MKKKKKLPTIKVEGLERLDLMEMKNFKGGFLSIGYDCSQRNKCSRHFTKSWGYSELGPSDEGSACRGKRFLY